MSSGLKRIREDEAGDDEKPARKTLKTAGDAPSASSTRAGPARIADMGSSAILTGSSLDIPVAPEIDYTKYALDVVQGVPSLATGDIPEGLCDALLDQDMWGQATKDSKNGLSVDAQVAIEDWLEVDLAVLAADEGSEL